MSTHPAGRPRTEPAEVRRNALLTSAERVFLEKGVEKATIEEITIDASVSKGAFYLHFSSKLEVIEALRNRFIEDLLGHIDDEVGKEADGDWERKLTTWARACSAGYLDATRRHSLVFMAAPAPAREGMTRNVLIDNLTDLLVGGRKDGVWTLDDPVFTATFLFNALHGVVNREGIAESPGERGRLLEAVEAHFRRVVG